MRRLWPGFVLSVTFALSGCGGGGSDADASPYGNPCGPIRPDGGTAGQPNTLDRAIFANTTLKKSCSPYYFTDPVYIAAEVTIEAGVKLIGPQGGKRSRITVTRTGRLLATGTKEEPIIFTSLYAESGGGPLGGQWTGLLFLESPPGSHLENVIIEYAGGAYAGTPEDEFSMYEFPVEGSILNDSAQGLEIVDVWVRRSKGYAAASTTSADFELDKKNIYTVFDRVTMTDNEFGIWVPVDQAGTLGPDLCWAERDAMGACPAAATPPAGVYVEAHLDSMLGRTPENLTRDAVWKAYAVPWKVENVNIMDNALLEISDGAELRMTSVGGIAVGVNEPGALKMLGTTRGITITSFYQSPTDSQHWNGVWIWDMTDSARTELRGVDLGYGGKKSPLATEAAALITIYNSDPTIVGNHVHHSLGSGIHWDCQSAPPGLEEPPLPSTNTSDDATIACAAAIGGGIAENYGCACPGGGCAARCPQPNP